MKTTLGPVGLQTEFELVIPDRATDLVVLCSGGLDSTTLLAALVKENKDSGRNLPVWVLTAVKHDGSVSYAERVVKAVRDLYKADIAHVNYLPNNDAALAKGRLGLQTIKLARKVLPESWIMYGAMNKQAPDEVRPFTQTLEASYNSLIGTIALPFLYLHKPQIVDLMVQVGASQLAVLTHSCTVLSTDECGHCYSCNERRWGFEALGLKDPGTDYSLDVVDKAFDPFDPTLVASALGKIIPKTEPVPQRRLR